MAKRLFSSWIILFLLLVSFNAAQAQDLSGYWDVKVQGADHFTDTEPSQVPIAETETFMQIDRYDGKVVITFGGFGGVHTATIFKGAAGEDNFVATWWYEAYPYETKVLTGLYEPSSGKIRGRMLYPRVSERPGFVPGWVDVEYVATRRTAMAPSR